MQIYQQFDLYHYRIHICTENMEMIQFDADSLRLRLEKLSFERRIIFALSCCERLFPNYAFFSRLENWGEPQIFRTALDVLWSAWREPPMSQERVKNLLRDCESFVPDTENFSSEWVSPALDASIAVVETLQCILDGLTDHCVTIASLARDTVDMFIQEWDELDYELPDFERQIANDPLMIRELTKQQEDLRLLEEIKELDTLTVEAIRTSSQNNGVSNVGAKL
jgi:hypothetical protein